MPYGHQHLTWRGDTLHCGTLAIRIEPDSTYAGVWRIRLPDGSSKPIINGNKVRGFQIELAGLKVLTAGDFVL